MIRRDARDRATAVEFALLSPLLVLMAAWVIGYGGYFWISHSVQQLANDAARAAIAGLDSAQRVSLAQKAVSSEQSHYAGLSPARLRVTEVEGATGLLVQVSYDASNSPFWALQGLAPMPSTTVVQQANIRRGGY